MLRTLALSLFLSLSLAASSPAQAGELAGVTMPDTATLGGQTLVLNGMGLREKYMFDIYVGGLYLPSKTTSQSKALNDDVPKRMVMHFVYKTVTATQMVDSFNEGLEKQGEHAALDARWQKLCGWMTDIHEGDVVTLDYVPGTGTTVSINGTARGTIEGTDFMKAVFALYVGDHPATNKLRTGLLGG